jgi:hypothetical protein
MMNAVTPSNLRFKTPARWSAATRVAGPIGAGSGFLHQGERSTVSRFRFVAEEAAQFPISLLCRTVGVSRQGFYAWRPAGGS